MSNLEIRYLSVFRPKATAEIMRCQEGRGTKCQHFVAEPNRYHVSGWRE